MQPATDSTVLGDFNGATLTADGVTSRFFRSGEKFFIHTQGDDGQNHDYEVLYTFGYYPLQQYLAALPGGRMQAVRTSWDSEGKKWFHQYAGQSIHHRDWLHWTGNAQNWNTMCASCHSTDLQKKYDFARDAYHTTWKDINVGCESCHGPGQEHLERAESGRDGVPTGLSYGKDADTRIQLNACAPCHARKSDISQTPLRTGELLDDHIPQVISNEFYYADGQIREEDYEYGSFAQSRMYHANVRCTNCHNPHSGKLLLAGNDLCMSCHKPGYDTEKHHFHPVSAESARCVSCHMPSRTYMGNDARRDHSFRVPRPDQAAVYGTPDACTGCHRDKKPTWAAAAITKWYGPKRAYHFSDDLLPGSQLVKNSETHLIKLLGDTLQPAIARATAGYYLGSLLTPLSAEALLRALDDRQAMVRYQALRSLQSFPSDVWRAAALRALSDRVRAVRIAAAALYHAAGGERIVPASAQKSYHAADAENRSFLNFQTDFSVGNVMLADYYMQGGEHLNAIKLYVRGLKKDSLMNYARLNLAVAYTNTARNPEALKTLNEAAAVDPENERIFYNLGLLQHEMNDVPAAMKNFQEAIRLGSSDPGVYYNYGLLLQQQGNIPAAEQILLKGFAVDPEAPNINYALAYLYASQGNLPKARSYARALQGKDPDNPDYQGLFRSLGL
jgi:predicted CXXCH cytochrome family protein